MTNISRRTFLAGGTALAAGTALGGSALLTGCGDDDDDTAADPVTTGSGGATGEPWKLGALIPITGIETQVGESMKVSTEIAVDQINAAGGLLGRPIELIVEDEASDPAVAVDKARKLIQQDEVAFIVGTLISAVRNAVVEVTSAAKVPLFNPTYYEGGLCQEYFLSTGALPNQQIEPFVPWIYENLGKSFYLIGSDYAWPRGSFAFVKSYLEELGGTVVGEEYVPFGVTDFSTSISRILDAAPDVLYPLVAGSDGITFWKQLAGFDFKGKRASHSVSEAIVAGLDAEVANGIISAGPYFMVIDSPANDAFIEEYHSRLDDNAVVDTFGEGMYDAVHLLAEGAKRADSLEIPALMKGIQGATFDAPQGPLVVDAATQHAALGFHIAEIKGSGWRDFEIIESKEAIAPAADCGTAPTT
jgi:urea transport system substrate-binding protein